MRRTDDGLVADVDRAHLARLCEGHFPGDPLVPGAYIAELMADAAALLAPGTRLVGIERATFHRPLRPADDVSVRAHRTSPGCVDAEVLTAGRRTAHARIRVEDVS